MAYRRRYARRRPATRARRRTYSRRPAAKSRRRTYARRSRRTPQLRSTYQADIPMRVPKYIKALINPFDKDTYGCRIPDSSTSPSSFLALYDNNAQSCNSANLWMSSTLYVPNSYAYAYEMTSASGSAVTVPAAYGGSINTAKQTVVRSNYSLARPVSHGIRITCAQAATATIGYCHICLVPLTMSGATWTALPLTVAQMASLPTYRRVTISSLTNNPLVVVNRYNDDTAYRYSDVNNDESILSPVGDTFHSWMGIIVAFTEHGQNATVAIANVENLCHFEVQALPNGVSSDGPGEPSNPAVLEAACNAASQSNASFIEGTYDEEQHYKQCLNNAGMKYRQMTAALGNRGLPGITTSGRLG